ncbi:MAG: hypothetical protein QI223_09915 [Candidatus Korarchaeota archaeon]|nr:hypothetical protein [Candidatus Korarchaeota archaeon]
MRRAGWEGEEVDKGRRTFLKIGLAAGASALLAYLLWPTVQLYLRREGEPVKTKPPETEEPPVTEGPAGTEAPTEARQPEEVTLELEEYPGDSPVGHAYPYLVIEPVSGSSERSPGGSTERILVQLNCCNRGGAPSTAVLEAFRIDGPFSLPLSLSSLPKLAHIPVYLSPGSTQPVWLDLVVPAGTTGVLFVLSDPMLDACPRRFASADEMSAQQRRVIYFGR